MKPGIHHKVFGLILYGPMLFFVLALSGCFTTKNIESESSDAMIQLTQITPINSRFPSPTLTPTGKSSHTWTKTPIKSPTYTSTPRYTSTLTSTPTISQTQTPYPNGYVLFQDDFETGADERWAYDKNTNWQIQVDENGNHNFCNFLDYPNLSLIDIGDESWQNYQLEFDVKDVEFGNQSEIISIYVRNKGHSSYNFDAYFKCYDPSSPEEFSTNCHAYLAKILNGKFLPITGPVGEDVGITAEDQWYKVSITVFEGYISFFWDNELVINYRDEEYIPTGSISFLVNYGICFDNIKVTNIGKVEQ